jgi:hypothetical protein
MGLFVAAMLDNPEAQREVVALWGDTYQPGMTHRELVAATMPPRPAAPMLLTEAWDQVAHEAGVWIAAQTGDSPPDTATDDLFTGMSAADIPEIEDVPLVDAAPDAMVAAYKPGMSHSSSSRSSTYLSDREHQQRIDAARRSAEKRRKAREDQARKRMMAPRHYRDGSVAPTEFQEAMGIFAQRGVRGEDLEKDPETGHLRGKNSAAQQRFAQAINDSGYDVTLFADGSGVARRGSHAILLSNPKSNDWSMGAMRMERPQKPKKARKAKELPRAWGRKKKRR